MGDLQGRATNAGSGKNLSVRLPAEHMNIVMALATVDGITMGEVIRHAILSYGELRRSQPDFADKVNEVKRQLDAALLQSVGEAEG